MDKKYNVIIQKPVDMQGKAQVHFRESEFEALIYSKGYRIYLDRFLHCPCKEQGVNSARVTCSNCLGSGFFLSERIQTKAVLTNMNINTEYKDWSVENMGTVSISTLNTDKVTYMDRIVLYELEAPYHQLIYPITLPNGNFIAFLDYPPVKIEKLYAFMGDNEPLLAIDVNEAKIGKEGEVDLTSIRDLLIDRDDFVYDNKTTLSIGYTYMPSYHIIDVTRNIMNSNVEDVDKKLISTNFPYHSIGRSSHLVLDRGNLIHTSKNMTQNTPDSTTREEEFNSRNKNIDSKFAAITNR